MNISDSLIALVQFSDQELKDVLLHFEKEELEKGATLIKEGQYCKKIYYIEKGLGRSFYLKKDGKEVTQWFFGPDTFMSSADSFFNQTPSKYFLEVLDDAVLYSISHENINLLLAKYHKMEKLVRLLTIDMFGKFVDKLNAIQFQTARERYDYMIAEFPALVYQVPLSHIASYLGMTQETLSRIRRKS